MEFNEFEQKIIMGAILQVKPSDKQIYRFVDGFWH